MDDWQPIDEVQLCTIFRSLPPARQPHRPDLVRAGGLLLRRRAPAMAQAQGLSRGGRCESAAGTADRGRVIQQHRKFSIHDRESDHGDHEQLGDLSHLCHVEERPRRTDEGRPGCSYHPMAGWLAGSMDGWMNGWLARSLDPWLALVAQLFLCVMQAMSSSTSPAFTARY